MKWIVTICCALLAGAVLGGLSWFLFPPKYESAAFVRVSMYEPVIWEQRSGIDLESYKRNMVEMIKSPPVLERALEDKAIQEIPLYQKNSADPVNWLADDLQVTGGNGELIRIAMRSDDEKGIKEIVDAVLAAFKSKIIDDEHDRKQLDYDNLERKFKAYENYVLEKERQLYNLSQQIGTADAPSAKVQYRMQTDELDTLLRLRADIQKRISDVRFKCSLAKVLEDLENKNGPSAADGDIQVAMQRSAQILKLSKLLRQLKDTDKSSGAKSPDPAAQISTKIAKTRERIEKISADDQQAIESMKKK
jgi:capsular polysaccharide biosynthesis protein